MKRLKIRRKRQTNINMSSNNLVIIYGQLSAVPDYPKIPPSDGFIQLSTKVIFVYFFVVPLVWFILWMFWTCWTRALEYYDPIPEPSGIRRTRSELMEKGDSKLHFVAPILTEIPYDFAFPRKEDEEQQDDMSDVMKSSTASLYTLPGAFSWLLHLLGCCKRRFRLPVEKEQIGVFRLHRHSSGKGYHSKMFIDDEKSMESSSSGAINVKSKMETARKSKDQSDLKALERNLKAKHDSKDFKTTLDKIDTPVDNCSIVETDLDFVSLSSVDSDLETDATKPDIQEVKERFEKSKAKKKNRDGFGSNIDRYDLRILRESKKTKDTSEVELKYQRVGCFFGISTTKSHYQSSLASSHGTSVETKSKGSSNSSAKNVQNSVTSSILTKGSTNLT